ncbi:MAG: hypothetical protein GC190_10010 [Alphaproteobacteria bacterium]|nr:hypothetical protein [Alphaproteobacteria bacterium]
MKRATVHLVAKTFVGFAVLALGMMFLSKAGPAWAEPQEIGSWSLSRLYDGGYSNGAGGLNRDITSDLFRLAITADAGTLHIEETITISSLAGSSEKTERYSIAISNIKAVSVHPPTRPNRGPFLQIEMFSNDLVVRSDPSAIAVVASSVNLDFDVGDGATAAAVQQKLQSLVNR